MTRRAINIGDALQQLEDVLDDVNELADWPDDIDEHEVTAKIQALTEYLAEQLLGDEDGK